MPATNLLRREGIDNYHSDPNFVLGVPPSHKKVANDADFILGMPAPRTIEAPKTSVKGNNALSTTARDAMLSSAKLARTPLNFRSMLKRIEPVTSPDEVERILKDHAEGATEERLEVREDQKLTEMMWRLPLQPSCDILIGNTSGDSDYGKGRHSCTSCEGGCSSGNKQLPIRMGWSIVPALHTKPAYDLMMVLELQSINQMKPYTLNGIHHRMRFTIHSDIRAAGDFVGEMGPQIMGGARPNDMMSGVHVFSVMDTQFPVVDGGGRSPGRWLALPGKHHPGVVGTCRRHCINCDDLHPQHMIAGHSTGTICTANVKVDSFGTYVYRLVQREGTRKVEYDAATYIGAEWEVRIMEQSSGVVWVLGTIVTEGTSNMSGITHFSATHEHLGCSPCDAYYQAIRATGPFILNPRGAHEIARAIEETPMRSDDQICSKRRAIGLGGYTILYESGPGVVEEPWRENMTVYRCNHKGNEDYGGCAEGHLRRGSELHLRPGNRAWRRSWKEMRNIPVTATHLP
jgi:hypothetical protein